jgi:hypothetical protein
MILLNEKRISLIEIWTFIYGIFLNVSSSSFILAIALDAGLRRISRITLPGGVCPT